MKLLHIADLHLDSPFTGLTKQLHSLQKHLIQSPYQAFERCVSIAINQAVDLMVIAGDIYDTEQQTVTAQHFFLKQLERLHIAKIPVVLCHGNHDYLRMECQSVPYPDNVHLFKDQEVTAIDIPLADDQTVRCYGFSYTKRWVDARMIDSYPVNPHETTYTLGVLRHSRWASCQTMGAREINWDLAGVCGLSSTMKAPLSPNSLRWRPWMVPGY